MNAPLGGEGEAGSLRPGRLAGVLTLVLVAAIFLWPEADREPVGSPEPPADATRSIGGEPTRPASTGAIASRRVDSAAQVGEEHALDAGQREVHAGLVEAAPNLLESLQAGHAEWSELLIDLDASEAASAAHLKCSEAHLHGPCAYTVGFVITPVGDGTGTLAYARAMAGADTDRDCRAYASCLARERLGDTVRVPADVREPIAHQKTQTDNRDPELEGDLQALEEFLGEMEAIVSLLEQKGPDGSPTWAWDLALKRSYVRILREKVAALRG